MRKDRYGSSGMGKQNASLVYYICISGRDKRTRPIRMWMEKELRQNVKANVPRRIAIEFPAKYI